MTKKVLALGGALVALSAGVFGITNLTNSLPQSEGAQAVVLIKEDKFEPETLEIKKGTTVVFKNESSDLRWPASNLHPTHGIYPQFDPKQPVKSGDSWQFEFGKVGSWKYHDHLSPSIRGIIKVAE